MGPQRPWLEFGGGRMRACLFNSVIICKRIVACAARCVCAHVCVCVHIQTEHIFNTPTQHILLLSYTTKKAPSMVTDKAPERRNICIINCIIANASTLAGVWRLALLSWTTRPPTLSFNSPLHYETGATNGCAFDFRCAHKRPQSLDRLVNVNAH